MYLILEFRNFKGVKRVAAGEEEVEVGAEVTVEKGKGTAGGKGKMNGGRKVMHSSKS